MKKLVNEVNVSLVESTREEINYIDDMIVEFNKKKVPFTQEKDFIPINLTIKDDDNKLIAGVASWMYCWGCVYIDIMWVEESYRGKGYGEKLLLEVEKRARKLYGNVIHLDTFDFQAKDFYIKNGYSVVGTLEDCPSGHKRYFMAKHLLNNSDKI